MLRLVDVVIFVDHSKRELEFCKYIQSHLSSLGYTTKILSVNFDLLNFYLYRCKVLLIPHSLGIILPPLSLIKTSCLNRVIHLDW